MFQRKMVIDMLKPDKETFCRLVNDYNIIPVYRTIPADMETPVSIYLKVASARPGSFLLESGDIGEKARYSFIGSDPFLSVFTEGDKTIIQEVNGGRSIVEDEPLQALEDVFNNYKVYQPDDLPAFWGGAVGYLSYDMVKFWEKIPLAPEENYRPLCHFFFPQRVLIYDHRRHLLTIVLLVLTSGFSDDPGRSFDKAAKKMDFILNNLRKNLPCVEENVAGKNENVKDGGIKHPHSIDPLMDNFDRENFAAAVKKAKEYIRAGDIFQVVLSRRITRELKIHPFNLYRALRSLNPSPYQFYLSLDGFQVLGASPEMLVSLKDGCAFTRPIAGTRPRGVNETADINLAHELSRDEKERAEHMMLVDLGRNDLGRVCEYGSVEVLKLLEVEYFSHVIHLVSEVTGKIRPGENFAQLIKAAFPAGTVSGAPKIRAMEIISELEPVSRGPYAGAVGYISFNGEMDTCIAIRTMITGSNLAQIQAGAGIVADSDPYREFDETEHKMAASLRAIKLAEEWEQNDFNC